MITVVEGFLYYSNITSLLLFRVLLTLENSIKCFLFSPEITIIDVVSLLSESSSRLQVSWAYIYSISLFIAQIFTISIIFVVCKKYILKFTSKIRLLFSKKDRVVIFDYNEETRILINNIYKDNSLIYLFSNKKFTPSEELELEKKRVKIIDIELAKLKFNADANTNTSSGEIKRILKILQKSKRIILMDDSSTHNMAIFLSLTNILQFEKLNKNIPCYLKCDEDSIKEIIEERYNLSQSHNLINLCFFSLAEMRVRKVYTDHYAEIFKNLDGNVHVVIAGLGDTGKEFFKQAILLGATSLTNEILIDIVDIDATKKEDLLLQKFNEKAIKKENDVYTVLDNNSDGKLKIRFFNADLKGANFEKLLAKILSDMPVTLAAICVKNIDVSLHALNTMNQILNKTKKFDTPIAVRLSVDNIIVDNLDKNKTKYNKVFSIIDDESILNTREICARKIDEMAIKYNYRYNCLANKKDGIQEFNKEIAEEDWNALPAWKRNVNRAAGYYYNIHYLNNNRMNSLNMEKLLEKDEYHQAKIEHRRWNYALAVDGWTYGEKKDEYTKTHDCILKWDELIAKKQSVKEYDKIPEKIIMNMKD